MTFRNLSEVIPPQDLPSRKISDYEHALILNSMEILNHIFIAYKETGLFPIAPQVRGKFEDQKKNIKDLISKNILIEDRRNSPSRLKLSFVGFLQCDHIDAKAARKVIGRIYKICQDWFKLEHIPITQSFNLLCKALEPMNSEENALYYHRLLLLFSTTPLPIFHYSAGEEAAPALKDGLNLSILESITDNKSVEEYFDACVDCYYKQFGDAKNKIKETQIALEERKPVDFINLKEFSNIQDARIREFMEELNTCWKVEAPNACMLLIRALMNNALDYYYKDAEKKTGDGLKGKLNFFIKNESLEKTVKEAMVHLLMNAKIFGDIAAHSKDTVITMPDVDHCRAALKIFLIKIFK